MLGRGQGRRGLTEADLSSFQAVAFPARKRTQRRQGGPEDPSAVCLPDPCPDSLTSRSGVSVQERLA